MYVAVECTSPCALNTVKHRTPIRFICDNKRDRKALECRTAPDPLTRPTRGGASHAGYPNTSARASVRLMPLPPRTTRYLTMAASDHPLAMGSKRQIAYVHRVVLYDSIGPGVHLCHWCGREVEWCAQGIRNLVADHLDENRWNNAPENLVPSCRRCNSERSRRPDFLTHCSKGHELTPENAYRPPKRPWARQCRICSKNRQNPMGEVRRVGSRHHRAKLTESLVREIRQRYAQDGVTQTSLAREYGVSTSIMSKIVRGKAWRHVS